MGRYSPGVNPPSKDLFTTDYSGIGNALLALADRRERRRRDEEDRQERQQERQQEFDYRASQDALRRSDVERTQKIQDEERANAMSAAGGTPLLDTNLGRPGVTYTPDTTAEVPIEMLRRGARSLGPSTASYLATLNGENYVVDPAIAARREGIAEASGEVAKRQQLLAAAREMAGEHLTPDMVTSISTGIPLSQLNALTFDERMQLEGEKAALRQERDQARLDLDWWKAKSTAELGRINAGIRAGEAGSRTDARTQAEREAFADKMVAAGQDVNGERMPLNEKYWKPGDLDVARRLGMTYQDYRAASQRYHDKRNPPVRQAQDWLENLIDSTGAAGPPPPARRGGPPNPTAAKPPLKEPSAAQLERARTDPLYRQFLTENGYRVP